MRGYCIILANSKPELMKDFYSYGKILFAVKDGKYELIRPAGYSMAGERCYLEGSYFVNDHW
jgi:hypothetical protein